MGEFIAFFVLAIFITVGAILMKKIALIRTRTYRPHPARPVAPPAAPSPEPAAPRKETEQAKTENDLRAGAFEPEKDFESSFPGVSPDPGVTYEEGIDPCHDGMDHAVSGQEQEETGMSRETANEIVRSFVMSEVFSRRRRR